jgi:hypothetical protein
VVFSNVGTLQYKFAIVNNQRPKYIDMNEERTVALNDLTGALGG